MVDFSSFLPFWKVTVSSEIVRLNPKLDFSIKITNSIISSWEKYTKRFLKDLLKSSFRSRFLFKLCRQTILSIVPFRKTTSNLSWRLLREQLFAYFHLKIFKITGNTVIEKFAVTKAFLVNRSNVSLL